MSTTRATMKHAAVYSAAAMAGRLIGFIMLPFYAHVLRGHGYAVIGMLDVGLGFLLSLLVYGVQGSIVRLYHDEKDPARKPVVVSTGIILIGAVTAVLTVPLMIFSKPIASLLIDDAALNHLVILALLSFNFDLMGQAATSWLLVRSRSTQMAGLSLLRLVLGLTLNIYLVLIRDMGLNGYFLSSLIVNLFSCTVFVGIAFRECGHEFDRGIAQTIRSFLVPLMPGSLASWVGRQVERIMAKALINLESVGILEMGYRFPVMISIMLVSPFMRSWDTRRYEIADQPGAPRTIAAMFSYFMFILCWAGLILAVVVQPLLQILTPAEFAESYRIARVEIVTVILQGAYYHLLFGLAYAKDTATISRLRIVTAVIKVGLSWIFISTWGIYGAAYSAAATGLLMDVATFRYSQKHYHLPLEWRTLATIIASSAGIFILLTRWDVAGTGLYIWLDGSMIPSVADLVARTPLGTMKDGKLVSALMERSGPIAIMVVKGLAAASYIAVLPVIHRPTRVKWMARIRGLATR